MDEFMMDAYGMDLDTAMEFYGFSEDFFMEDAESFGCTIPPGMRSADYEDFEDEEPNQNPGEFRRQILSSIRDFPRDFSDLYRLFTPGLCSEEEVHELVSTMLRCGTVQIVSGYLVSL
ncbi:MAG TPA: hypothetical protein P5560_11215 [Thermotogota bacterium]|nr:hypothetical protein [Thermotogota bacterium]HRW93508.1 hypothetical protein [Thermotogota bacterium]